MDGTPLPLKKRISDILECGFETGPDISKTNYSENPYIMAFQKENHKITA